jgi:hypothetical protein
VIVSAASLIAVCFSAMTAVLPSDLIDGGSGSDGTDKRHLPYAACSTR